MPIFAYNINFKLKIPTLTNTPSRLIFPSLNLFSFKFIKIKTKHQNTRMPECQKYKNARHTFKRSTCITV